MPHSWLTIVICTASNILTQVNCFLIKDQKASFPGLARLSLAAQNSRISYERARPGNEANVLYERARPGNEANVLYCATVSEPN